MLTFFVFLHLDPGRRRVPRGRPDLVYVDAVMVLFLFVVMLDVDVAPLRGDTCATTRGVLVAVVMLEMLTLIGVRARTVPFGVDAVDASGGNNVAWVARRLFTFPAPVRGRRTDPDRGGDRGGGADPAPPAGISTEPAEQARVPRHRLRMVSCAEKHSDDATGREARQ